MQGIIGMKKIGDTGSFKNFYENNRIYIDKTEYLYRMLVDNPLEYLSQGLVALVNLLP